MTSLRLWLAALMLSCAASVHGQVTITFVAGQLNNGAGTALPNGTLVLLIADTQGNGFGSATAGTLNVGDFINGSDDRILFRSVINVSPGGAQDSLANATFSGQWNAGDSLALVWLPGLTSGSFSLTSGQSYGLFTTTNPSPPNSEAWVTPASGTVTLGFHTQSEGGTYANALGNATLTAIPEPSACAAVMGLATLGLAAWRRRNAQRSSQPPPDPRQPLLDLRP